MATTPLTSFVAGYPSYPVAASTKINAGDIVLVYITSGTAPGYAIPGQDVADAVYVGIAVQTADNTNGSNGTINVNVYPPGRSLPEMTYASPTQAIVGLHAFASSNQTVELAGSSTNKNCVGTIIAVNQQGDTGTVVIDDTARFTIAST